MAHSGLELEASTTNWLPLRQMPHSCERAIWRLPNRLNLRLNQSECQTAKPYHPLTAPIDLHPPIHGDAILLFDHGDKVAVRLAVRVAVRRQTPGVECAALWRWALPGAIRAQPQ